MSQRYLDVTVGSDVASLQFHAQALDCLVRMESGINGMVIQNQFSPFNDSQSYSP